MLISLRGLDTIMYVPLSHPISVETHGLEKQNDSVLLTPTAGLPVQLANQAGQRREPQMRKTHVQRSRCHERPLNLPSITCLVDLLLPPYLRSSSCLPQVSYDNCLICPSNSLSFARRAASGSSTDFAALRSSTFQSYSRLDYTFLVNQGADVTSTSKAG